MRAFAENKRTARSGVWGRCTALFVAAMLMTVLSTNASAQRITGTLRGLVNDPNGAAVTGATISATNQQTGVTEHTVSTSTGSYEITHESENATLRLLLTPGWLNSGCGVATG